MRQLALFLSFSVGFLSLSQEILWVRLVSFSQAGRPHAFPTVLAPFLVGIALGANIGRILCAKSSNLLRTAAYVLLISSVIDFGALYVAPQLLVGQSANPSWQLLNLAMLIALTAGLKGMLFPIVHHLGTTTKAGYIGRSVSYVYLGNVIGSSLGPIVIGFWLLDRIDFESAYALIGTLAAVVGGIALIASSSYPRGALLAAMVAMTTGVYLTILPPDVIRTIANTPTLGGQIKHIIQNKHGIIHVAAEDPPRDGGDYTYGGNVYDGRINVDMSVNSNGLDRAYLMALLHPDPRRVLIIGLSTGAWTRAIAGFPGVESIDVIEINPGYLDLIRDYPEVSPILDDPRVHIHIDDGRRWLRAHPDERYDLVFQNTTYHWRAYSTLLLSVEYLREAKNHLYPGGIIATNTTRSLDVYRTALEVFPYASRYRGFVYMSDNPLVKRPDAEMVLRQCQVGETPAFTDKLLSGDGIGYKLINGRLEPAQEVLNSSQTLDSVRVISDMNLIPEYRHGQPSPFPWLRPFLPPTPLGN